VYLEQLCKDDPRVIAINNPQSIGAPASRNKAILAATGDFVTGLDDDDYFHHNRIEIFVENWAHFQLSNIPLSCLYSQNIIFNTKKETHETRKLSCVSTRDFYTTNPVGNQVFAPRDYYIKAGLFDEELPAWQDLEMFYRIVEKFGYARVVDMPLYCFFDDERADRISKSSDKVRRAAEIMIRKHAKNDKKITNLFLSQVFAPHYGYKPNLNDVLKFTITDYDDFKLVAKMVIRMFLP
jgi:glycosyltransferase involved in cell wall biosynthesis